MSVVSISAAGSDRLWWRRSSVDQPVRVRRQVAFHCGAGRVDLRGWAAFGIGQDRRRQDLRAERLRALESLKEWVARWSLNFKAKPTIPWYHNGLQRYFCTSHETLPFIRWVEPPVLIPLAEGRTSQSVRKVQIHARSHVHACSHVLDKGVVEPCRINAGMKESNWRLTAVS